MASQMPRAGAMPGTLARAPCGGRESCGPDEVREDSWNGLKSQHYMVKTLIYDDYYDDYCDGI